MENPLFSLAITSQSTLQRQAYLVKVEEVSSDLDMIYPTPYCFLSRSKQVLRNVPQKTNSMENNQNPSFVNGLHNQNKILIEKVIITKTINIWRDILK